MEFVPTDEYIRVSLQEGLNALQIGLVDKLFSDGLDDYEYIYFDKEKGFCYEDNCVIGSTFDQTLDRLHSVGWCFKNYFFIKEINLGFVRCQMDVLVWKEQLKL